MEKKLPVIGILSERNPGEILPFYETTGHYIEQVERAGGLPVQLPLSLRTGPAHLAEWVRLCDGVLLPGGDDIDPSFYGAAPLHGFELKLSEAQLRSQRNELDFIRMAADAGLPMLGICLGMQALAVAFGGALYQDVPTEFPGAVCHHQDDHTRGAATHDVTIVPGTLLASLCGASAVETNSFHHQAVRTVPAPFVCAASASDGLIEAMEAPARRMIGVQWHPENLAAEHPEAFALFTWLVQSARGQ